jgi:hypothetical protein
MTFDLNGSGSAGGSWGGRAQRGAAGQESDMGGGGVQRGAAGQESEEEKRAGGVVERRNGGAVEGQRQCWPLASGCGWWCFVDKVLVWIDMGCEPTGPHTGLGQAPFLLFFLFLFFFFFFLPLYLPLFT